MMRLIVLLQMMSVLAFAQAANAANAAPASLPKGLMKLDGRPAPPLQLADMDGKTVDLATRKGRWVIVHFWASWCGPCRKELPTLQRMSEKVPSAQVELIMVNTAESDEQVFAFLPTLAPDINTYMDRDGRVTDAWQPRGLPSSFIVDPAGKLRYLALGGRDWDSPAYVKFLRSLKPAPSAAAPAEKVRAPHAPAHSSPAR